MSVRGLFETHLTVADLARSVSFYRDVVGLPVALEVPERGAAFHWIGPQRPSTSVTQTATCSSTSRCWTAQLNQNWASCPGHSEDSDPAYDPEGPKTCPHLLQSIWGRPLWPQEA
jgi:hypothetical protein